MAFQAHLVMTIRERSITRATRVAWEVTERLRNEGHEASRTDRSPIPDNLAKRNTVEKFRMKEQSIEKEIEELHSREASKLLLFDQVARTLQSLGCEDKFDLLDVDVRLPSL